MFKKIFLGYLIVLFISFIVLGLAFTVTVRSYLLNDTLENLERVAQSIASTPFQTGQMGISGGGRMHGAYFSLANRIAYADYVILREDGLVLASSNETDFPTGLFPGDSEILEFALIKGNEGKLVSSELVAVAYPIRISGQESSALLFLYTQPELLNQLNLAILGILVSALTAGIVVSSAAGFLITRKITSPLKQLSQKAGELAGRRFGNKLTINTGDELEELAGAFNHLSERLLEYDQRQKYFFQKASHELRTPLMSIQGYAEAIRDGIIKPEETKQGLSIIVRESERMKKLVDHFLYLAKVETPSEGYFPVKMDLAVAAEESVKALYSLALEKRISIELKRSDKNNIILGDEENVHRLFLNLLVNAMRYATSRIIVEISGTSVTVDDDGPGFKAGEIEKVFDPFYSGEKGGSGLGMTISRAIADKHGAEITAGSSPVSGGARVKVIFPAPQ